MNSIIMATMIMITKTAIRVPNVIYTILLLKVGASVGATVGCSVGTFVGAVVVGESVTE